MGSLYMDQVTSLLQQLKISDNPILFCIIAAVILLVTAIVIRSLIGTLIIAISAGIFILVILYATGHPLPKLDLKNLNLPDLSKFLPTSDNPNADLTSPANAPKKLTLPSLPDNPIAPASKDPLKDAIIKGRQERNSNYKNFSIPGF